MKDSSLDFLPEEERAEAKDLMKKIKQQEIGGPRLVIPKIEEGGAKKKKKLSWSAKRKLKKQEKEAAKRRKRGETATTQAVKTKKKEKKNKPEHVKSDLFEGVKAEPPPPPEHPPKPEHKKPEHKRREHKQKEPEVEIRKGAFSDLHLPSGNGGGLGLGVNLVPEGAKIVSGRQPWVLGLVLVLLIAAGWLVAAGLSISKVNDVQAKVLNANAEAAKLQILIKDLEDAKPIAELLQKQFKAVDQLLDSHIYWDTVFAKVEEQTIPDVYYLTMTANKNGQVVLSAIAKSYDAAARQIRAFELAPDFIKSVEVNEARVETQPDADLPVPIVSFDMNLLLVDGFIYKNLNSGS